VEKEQAESLISKPNFSTSAQYSSTIFAPFALKS
jgi:hypothetical protein